MKATLSIEINVSCPGCDHYFDLVTDTDLNDGGSLFDEVMPDSPWIDAHEKFHETVNCPECHKDFEVNGIDW